MTNIFHTIITGFSMILVVFTMEILPVLLLGISINMILMFIMTLPKDIHNIRYPRDRTDQVLSVILVIIAAVVTLSAVAVIVSAFVEILSGNVAKTLLEVVT